MSEQVFLQYGGKTVEGSRIVSEALKIWTKGMKRAESELKTMDLYVKPQEGKVYYVFNKKENGSFSI